MASGRAGHASDGALGAEVRPARERVRRTAMFGRITVIAQSILAVLIGLFGDGQKW